jgi:hypothetical protein
MFCSVNSLLEQHSSRNSWNSVLTKAKWNIVLTETCSDYNLSCPHLLFKVSDCPNNKHKFSPAKTLFAMDQFEFFMDRLCYQILLLHFNTLYSLYKTAEYIQSCHVLGNSLLWVNVYSTFSKSIIIYRSFVYCLIVSDKNQFTHVNY